MAKIVGRAVALARGYYPDDGEHCRIIEEGEQFNLVEGLEKGKWFTVLELAAGGTKATKAESVKQPKSKDHKSEQTKQPAVGDIA